MWDCAVSSVIATFIVDPVFFFSQFPGLISHLSAVCLSLCIFSNKALFSIDCISSLCVCVWYKLEVSHNPAAVHRPWGCSVITGLLMLQFEAFSELDIQFDSSYNLIQSQCCDTHFIRHAHLSGVHYFVGPHMKQSVLDNLTVTCTGSQNGKKRVGGSSRETFVSNIMFSLERARGSGHVPGCSRYPTLKSSSNAFLDAT